MKKLVVLILIAVGGLVAYNYFTTGKIGLIPSSSVSPEELELKRLEKDFKTAQSEFLQGSRGASIAGLDTPADVIGAMRKIDGVEKALISLKRRITSETAKKKADQLLNEITAFKSAHK